MPMAIYRQYFTVDRSPQEVRDLWEWAKKECEYKIEHENPYAMGVLYALEYLMGEIDDFLPQNYKGKFTKENVLRQSKEQFEIEMEKRDAERPVPPIKVDTTKRHGNPKIIYRDPAFAGPGE